MRVFILSLFLCCAAYGDAVTNSSPTSFETAAEMDKWAMSAFGGAWKKELAYKKQKLVVYFRSHTSGVSTSEPNVFVERGGRWVRVLTAMTFRCDMDATIEGDALILWRLEGVSTLAGPNRKRAKTEYLRLNLKALDAE